MGTVDIVTGCDCGIGYSVVKIYIENNNPIIYSYLRDDPFPDSEISWGIKLDLRDEESIVSFSEKSIEIIKKNKFQVKNMLNNAGIGLGGTVENTPMLIYREVMEVNYFGQVSLTQKLLPEIINSKGRIILHGSMGGRISLPFFSPYSASKYALEALNDSLRREMRPFGVEVTILETGGVATPIWQGVKEMDLSFIDVKYKPYTTPFLKKFIDSATRSLSPDKAAVKLYKLLNRKRLPYRYRISQNSLKNILPLFIPDRILDAIISKMLK